jgi:hypothetical protein
MEKKLKKVENLLKPKRLILSQRKVHLWLFGVVKM